MELRKDHRRLNLTMRGRAGKSISAAESFNDWSAYLFIHALPQFCSTEPSLDILTALQNIPRLSSIHACIKRGILIY